MKKLLSLAALVSLFLISVPALAHHGFAGRYDEEWNTRHSKRYRVSVHQSSFTDHFRSKGCHRQSRTMASGTWFRRIVDMELTGWNEDTLKPGDKINKFCQ